MKEYRSLIVVLDPEGNEVQFVGLNNLKTIALENIVAELNITIKDRRKTQPIVLDTGNRASDLVKPEHLIAIQEAADKAGVDSIQECLLHSGCLPEELSIDASRKFIDHLEAIPKERIMICK